MIVQVIAKLVETDGDDRFTFVIRHEDAGDRPVPARGKSVCVRYNDGTRWVKGRVVHDWETDEGGLTDFHFTIHCPLTDVRTLALDCAP